MIQGLLDVPEISMRVTCIAKTLTTTKKARLNVSTPCELQLTIYGHPELFDEVGRWLQDFDAYLQDPSVCHLNVKYCNPHRLSFIDVDSCPMVLDVVKYKPGLVFQTIPERPSLLDTISNTMDLPEALQPTAIKSTLKRYFYCFARNYKLIQKLIVAPRHQKQALFFMMCRERGWGNHHKIPDIWESVDNDRGRM